MNALRIETQADDITESQFLILAILKHYRPNARFNMHNSRVAQPLHQQYAAFKIGAFAIWIDKRDVFRPHAQFNGTRRWRPVTTAQSASDVS